MKKFAAKAADGVPFQNSSPRLKKWYEIENNHRRNTAGDPNANGLQTGESCGLNSGT
jgi:hypothetical protein